MLSIAVRFRTLHSSGTPTGNKDGYRSGVVVGEGGGVTEEEEEGVLEEDKEEEEVMVVEKEEEEKRNRARGVTRKGGNDKDGRSGVMRGK